MKAVLKLTCFTLAAALTACQTMNPPRVPSLPNEQHDDEYKAAVGDITMSIPTFKPLNDMIDQEDQLNFGNLKSEATLLENRRRANMSRSLASFQSLAASLGVSVAGTQIDSSKTSTTTGNLAGNADLSALAHILEPNNQSVRKEEESLGDLSASFSQQGTSSYSETFKSPEVPEAPATPEAPASVLAAMVAMLSPSAATFQLDPNQELRAVASDKMEANALEDYYNMREIAEANSDWLPYRLVFSVSVDPGWFTYLNQHDGIIEIDFDPDNADLIRVLNVSPAETSQTVDEFTASMEQLATTLAFSGGFSAIAAQGNANSFTALAQSLEGFRKQTNTIVSFLSPSKVGIRVRPSIIPNGQMAERQPTNMVFSAIVLVNRSSIASGIVETSDTDSPDDKVNANEAKIKGYSQYIAPISQTPNVNAEREKIVYECSLSFKSFFESQGKLKRKSTIRGNGPQFVYGPKTGTRESLVASEDRKLQVLIPSWPKPKQKSFGFAKEVTGLYDLNGNTATGYFSYVVSNPSYVVGVPPKETTISPSVSLTVDGDENSSNDLGTSNSLVGVVKIDNLKFTGEYGAPLRALVSISRAGKSGTESEVAVATLVSRVHLENTAPTITVDRAGVHLDQAAISDLTPELIETLVGKQILLYTDEE